MMTGLERELSGKVAIVTGAGRLRGIGRATANVLARMGADVVVTGYWDAILRRFHPMRKKLGGGILTQRLTRLERLGSKPCRSSWM